MRAADPRHGWLGQWDYAHRGLHGDGIAENSLASFGAAIAAGLGIECDLRASREGRAMVFHDETLDRMTEASGPLAGRTVGELTALRLKGSSECMPTLRDMLDCVAGQVPVLLELKATRAWHPTRMLCRAVNREVEGYQGAAAVMSYDPRVPVWFKRHRPEMLAGLVVSATNARTLTSDLRRWLAVLRSRPDFIAVDVRDLPGPLGALAQGRRYPPLVWTVLDENHLDLARQIGGAAILERPALRALEKERGRPA